MKSISQLEVKANHLFTDYAQYKMITEPLPESQIVVHYSINVKPGMKFRLWSSTYLCSNNSIQAFLLFWRGIELGPGWTSFECEGVFRFTLYFGGLRKDIEHFQIREVHSDPFQPFEIYYIQRNSSDIYYVEL